MRRAAIFGVIVFLAGACTLFAIQSASQSQQQNPPPQNPSSATVQYAQTPVPGSAGLQTVVLDPGHGGADTGARGPTGVAEKDIVMEFARITADALRKAGFQVVLTRQGDDDPSPDDRAAIANAQTNAIFISIHVASTGPIGSVRTYWYLFPSAAPANPAASGAASANPSANSLAAQLTTSPEATSAGFVPWREAQGPYVNQSHQLGDLIQLHLAQNFKDSPEVSWSAPVRVLRSVTGPAVAVEISSVAANPQQLEAMTSGFADGIASAVTAYKAIYPPGGK